eukprot:CAMPEP_0172467102 /NCGR_PEP_ID=MMETSP1065-20121228/57953_1 /TAXON_ID=265537 /ORGANISM="Amphiprora paludosa, Strain CCMP125" /LENGTH=117 /DNA_ID=CAMNT_0013224147 /DNA_START=164 /DNA_END=517 /DNA_ORIENTATION=-
MIYRGPFVAMGLPSGYKAESELPKMPAFVGRMRAAHGNAIENLALLAVVVTVAKSRDISLATPAQYYFYARAAHWPLCVSNVPLGRTLAFMAGWASLLWMVALVFPVASGTGADKEL